MASFAIVKPLPNGRRVWLSRISPFVTWGPVVTAERYPTENQAWQAIARLSPRDASGAAVISLNVDERSD